jgi:manganese transport protein
VTTQSEAVAGVARSGGDVLRNGRRGLRILPFLGPAFIACVAYIDPGNFATNIAGGSKFGYTLVWVIVASNLMAMLIQTLSAKLGIATGRNLPEVCRERFSRRTSILLWLQAEAIAMATDLAEFLGAALGFHLLLGVGLFPAAVLTGIAAFLILGLQRFGFRPLEATIAAIVAVIGACYVIELFYARPDLLEVGKHAVVPGFSGGESVLLAVGILGATVMPHVIYLHSALTQHRIRPQNDVEAKRLMRYTKVDVVIAMSIAGLINMAMLVMAASTFFRSGRHDVESLEGAHATLNPLVGGASSAIFALALLASGLSSSAVGTLSGQVVMQGFVQRQIPLALRRLVTMLPALVVVGLIEWGPSLGIDASRTLVLSQVVLSFGIPFALIPLVLFTSRRDVMGALVNHRLTTAAASLVAGLIVCLNVFLLAQTFNLV